MVSPNIRQIESTLNQLSDRNLTDSQKTSAPVRESPDKQGIPSQRQPHRGAPSFSMAVQPFPIGKNHDKTPTLPKLKSATISEHRHGANPALAMNLLKDIEATVTGWQKELQKLVRQIQDLYLEGPIVDGWLDSHERKTQNAQAQVRRSQTDRLRDYVEQELNQSDAKVTCQSPRTGYRLCGLDTDGQYWSRPCPPEQVPSVSLAIARYHKLRQLLNRKQELETRLNHLAETLVVLHSHLSKD
ncbi:MAG: hypothetical protein F6K58_19090 [Symploca sp. SIO2E9]|nr:hypothetical protein [Symploca sp. SIO2E9]